jgi:aminoglycoside N3'-acetyltransferase
MDLARVLSNLGIRRGDNLFVHTSLIPIITHQGFRDGEEACKYVYSSLRAVIGSSAVIGVSTATWETARFRRDFDAAHTPTSKALGLFSEHLRRKSTAHRTEHPVFSLCFDGPTLATRTCRDSLHRFAYGAASPWQTMIDDGYKILFLGLRDIAVMSLIHHAEQVCGVPYCYSKLFTGEVYRDGLKFPGPFTFCVKYKQLAAPYGRLERIFASALKSGIATYSGEAGYPIVVVEMATMFWQLVGHLLDDPFCLLEESPAFREGEIPADFF